MQGYPQVQPAYHGQVVQQQPVYNEQVDHQEPVYYDQVDHPPHTQFNPQTNVMVVRNRYLQNKVNELQSLLRNQNIQAEQTIPFRKRFRSNNEDETETLSTPMEADEHPQDFLSESDSEESDTDVAQEFDDSITDIDTYYTNIVRAN